VPDLDVSGRDHYADWLETTLLVRRGHLGLDAVQKYAQFDCGISAAEVSLGLKTMATRSRFLGDAYPFRVTDIAVQVRLESLRSTYCLLLLLTPGSPARQLVARSPTPDMAILFERVVVAAMKELLGPRSNALRFGWPSDEGRPQDFFSAIEWLANRMGITPGNAYRPPLRKDGGVDVVAWRPFPDGRSGFPVALVQCTLQGEVISKSKDIDLRNWAGWLTLDIDPTMALAVPGTISKRDWTEIALRALVLDRIRLAGLTMSLDIDSLPGALDFFEEMSSSLAEHLEGARN
jgi:hypothetical protein